MKLVIMGTGPFAVPSAEKLRQLGHAIELVVTRPVIDTAGKRPPAPVLDWAKSHQFVVFQPASINDPTSIETLTGINADLFFVCDYGQILSSDCLASSRMGGINLHGSLLPRHRGAAPVQWSILAGDHTTGVSVIHMSPKLDSGPVLASAETTILTDENAAELEPRLAELGILATCDAIEKLSRWDGSETLGTPQDARLATKAPRFSRADGQVDFRLPAEFLVRMVRAFQPWPGAFADLQFPNGKSSRIHFRSARCVSGAPNLAVRELGTTWAISVEHLPGSWPSHWQRLLAVQCSDGLLVINRLQPAGKREMSADEFLRGHQNLDSCFFSMPEIPSRFTAQFGIHS